LLDVYFLKKPALLGVSAPAINAVVFQASIYSLRKADNTLFIFIQMGVGIREKNFLK